MPTGRPSTAVASSRGGEAGYTLAVLIGILTVLAIVLAAAVPHWVARVQRAKEAELVARGLQYAEAIRVFQRRFGRLPNTLLELVEVEPRSIRQLWKNPFARGGEGGWVVLMEIGGQVTAIDPVTGELVGATTGGGESEGERQLGGFQSVPPPPPEAGVTRTLAVAGPIHGVKSRLRGEAYRHYFGQKDYGDWEFSVERLAEAIAATTPEGLLQRTSYDSIGRGFPFTPPGGKPAGGVPAVPAQGSGPGGKPPVAPGDSAPPSEPLDSEVEG